MTFLQNLWRDLVDKKLWPVAVALVLAAVAVPFLIPSGSSKVAATPAPAGGAATPVTEGGQVTVAIAPADKQHSRSGKIRDPFKPEIFAKVAKAVGAGGTASVPTPATPAPSDTTPSTPATPSGSGGGSVPNPLAPKPAGTVSVGKLTYYASTITLQLKRGGKRTKRTGVRGITYLPSPSYPLLVFLGVKSDGKTASFGVADGVVVSGPDRVCLPSRANCQLLELGVNDEVLFTKPPADPSKAKHYRLTIRRIGMTEVKKFNVLNDDDKSSARSASTSGKSPVVTLAPGQKVVAGEG